MKRLLFLFMLAESLLTATQPNLDKLLDRYMQAQATQNDFSGRVLVAKHGQVVYHKSFSSPPSGTNPTILSQGRTGVTAIRVISCSVTSSRKRRATLITNTCSSTFWPRPA